jgi:hypothetical protein
LLGAYTRFGSFHFDFGQHAHECISELLLYIRVQSGGQVYLVRERVLECHQHLVQLVVLAYQMREGTCNMERDATCSGLQDQNSSVGTCVQLRHGMQDSTPPAKSGVQSMAELRKILKQIRVSRNLEI